VIRKETRTFLRYFYSGVSECPIDRLGRILIPQALKTDATIKKNVVIIGMGKKIEIWAQERWDELVQKATADPDQIADIVSELGL
jgi:MraZ protein